MPSFSQSQIARVLPRSAILVAISLAVPATTVIGAVCIGDCTRTSEVTVNELITMVNIALGTAQAPACPHGIPSGSEVNVALIIQAVNNALNGCP